MAQKKLWTGIASLLGIAPGAGNDADSAVREERSKPARRSRSRPPSALQAAALDTYKDAIAAGGVHLLDLGAIKADLGAQWELVKGRVTTAVDGILRQRLTAADLHSRIDDASYLLVLHSRTGEEARMLCGMIALEVKHKLFGEDRELDEIKISTAQASEDGTVGLVEIDTREAVAEALKAERLAAAQAAAASDGAAPAPAAASWQTIVHKSLTKASGELVPVKDAFRSLDEMLNSAARSIDMPQGTPLAKKHPVYGNARHAESQTELARRVAAAQAIEESRRRADVAAIATADARQQEQPAETIDSVSFAYQPLWDCRRHAVTSYALNVKFQVGDQIKSLTEIENWATRPEIMASIDLLTAKKGLADLAQMISKGHKAILCLPLHSAILGNPGRRAPLLTLFGSVPPEVRNLVRIEIVDAYAGDWDSLPVLLVTWRRVCRDVALRLSLHQTDVERAKLAGATIVGGIRPEHPWTEAEAMKTMEAFAAAAIKAKLETYVYGLGSMSEVVCAACAGFRFLSGPAVAQETDFPAGVYALDSVNLYLRSQASPSQAS